MRLAYFRYCLLCVLAAWTVTACGPQAEFDSSVKPPGVIGRTSGTGPYPAHAVAVASMEMNTLYVPAAPPDKPMPLLVWGTGGCRDNGLRYGPFLREVASHGFFVISGGRPRFERPLRPAGTDESVPDPATEFEDTPEMEALPDTQVSQLLAAIDWAAAQTADPQSPYYGKIDLNRVGVMGHSCGGLQAIRILTDKRVKTAIAFNSGVLTKAPPGHADGGINLIVDKTVLADLNGPIAYIVGGPSDMAYENALDDLARIETVPVFFAENGVGHGGTFRFDENGGEYAKVAVAWMSWQLSGDEAGAKWFIGPDCRLCTEAGWQVQREGFADTPNKVETFTGTLSDGADWIAEVPENWNRQLLLYSHGYRPRLTPPESATAAARQALLDSGYALAASAYPSAGWALEQAVPSQVLVLDAFQQRFGKPERTLAWGSSMGGLVTAALAERHPERINGAITMCASSMGALPMMNMALDGAFALTTLIPADPPVAIAGAGDNFDGVARAVVAMNEARKTPQGRARVALSGVLGGLPSWSQPGNPRPGDMDYVAQEEEIAAAVERGLFLPRGDQETRAGGVFSWNTGIDYGALLADSGRRELVDALYAEAGLDLAADIAALNAANRVTADPDAVEYMRQNYTPEGTIGVPVLSMHTIGDGMTSPSLQRSYIDKVNAAGAGALIAGIWIERAGHCTQSAEEMQTAIGVLQDRIDSGEWHTETAKLNVMAGDGGMFIDYLATPLPRTVDGTATSVQ